MYIAKTDLATHIYPEIIDEISRADDTIITRCINGAISETKMYLSRFDIVQLFGTDVADPTITDEYLKNLVKDLTVWYLIKLANPNISYEHARNCYNDAIKTLKMIQSGDCQPANWPYADTTSETAPQGDSVFSKSFRKRHNNF